MTNQEFYHEGKKGQKWGQRNYQNKDGTWTALGKARRRKGIGGGRKESLSSRLVKRARLALGKGKKSSGTSEGDAAPKSKPKKLSTDEKQKILESVDAKLVRKHATELTSEEIQTAINKIDKAITLDRLAKEQTPEKSDLNKRLKKFADMTSSVSDIASNTAEFYENYKKIKKLRTDN